MGGEKDGARGKKKRTEKKHTGWHGGDPGSKSQNVKHQKKKQNLGCFKFEASQLTKKKRQIRTWEKVENIVKSKQSNKKNQPRDSVHKTKEIHWCWALWEMLH